MTLMVPDNSPLGVVPVLVGPLQVLLAILPGLLMAMLGAIVAFFKPQAMKHTLKLLWRQKLQVIGVVACAAGIIWGGRTLWARLGSPVAAKSAAGTDWPSSRGGLERLGAAPGAKGPNRGGLNWAWRQSGESFFSTPAIAGNRVYVASASLGAFRESGLIYCFDADSGSVLWTCAPPGYRPTFSSPVIAGKYLVCGEGLHVTRDSRLVCLDLTAQREDKVLWMFKTNSHVECTPVIDTGRVYVGAGDDGYYCLQLEPQADGAAKVLWHLPGKDYLDAETSLAVHNGKVYAGLGLGGKALCILDAETGKEIKRLAMPYPVFSPSSIVDGKLYIGMGNGDFVNTAEEARAKIIKRMREEGKSDDEIEAARKDLGPAGQVCCVDLATFKIDWTYHTPDTVLGAVAVAADQLFFGARDGFLYCLSRDGKFIAKWDAHAPIMTSPAVTDRYVYVVTGSGMLYALNRKNLDPVWEFVIGAQPLFISSPTVANGRVYVGSQHDGFVCAGECSDEEMALLWPGHLGGPGAGGNPDDSPLPENGDFHWQYPADQEGNTQDAFVTAPVAALGADIYVPLAPSGKYAKPGLACLPANADSQKTPAPRWFHETANGISLSPAAVGRRVFVVDGKIGDGGRHLHCIDAQNGRWPWQSPVAAGATGLFAISQNQIFVQDGENTLTCKTLDNGPVWSRECGELSRAPTVADNILLTVFKSPLQLAALDLPTGRELWRVSLEAQPVTSPAVSGATIFLGTTTGLEARSLVNGQPLDPWKLDGGGVSADFVLGRDAIVYVNMKGELVSIKREDGSVVSRIPGAIAEVNPIVSRDAILCAMEKGLMRIKLNDSNAKPELWADSSWLGKFTAPLVLKDSNVYAGFAGWGLARLGAKDR